MERVAACQCGGLRAIVTGEPLQVYLCHCRACQRRTGSLASGERGGPRIKSALWVRQRFTVAERIAGSTPGVTSVPIAAPR
jgi:hypothetical protein